MAATPKPVRKHLKKQLEIIRKSPSGNKQKDKEFAKRTEKSIKKSHKMAAKKGQKLYGITKKGKYVGNE